MLFDQRFRKYEDLLEYEAIERGRVKGREEGREEGREQGREEGRQQGRQEGVRLALQDVLQALLSDRHADLSPELGEKIQAAGEEELRSWIRSLVKGAEPRQLFAGH